MTPKHRHHIVIDARIRRSTTGRYVDRLLEHLQDVDTFHEYTILLQPDDPWKPKSSNFHTAVCKYKQFSLNPLEQFGFAAQLYALKPDLVHFTMSQQPLLYFGNIVTTSHDTTMYNYVRRGNTPLIFYKFKMALYRFLVWQSHRKSSKIIVPTKTVAREFIERQPFTKDKIVVTYEASEPEFKDKATKPKGVDGEFIMYVGTAFPHKNLPKLIEALDIMIQKKPNLKLVITGKREEKHMVELMEWAKNHPSYKNIIRPGFVTDGELKWLFKHCRAYVFVSVSEGWGLPTLEAMAHGAPVVVSNASVMPEVNGDAAHYFNPHKPQDIAEKTLEVLDNEALRTKLITAGYEHLKQFSWHTMAEETMTAYKAALKEEPGDN